MIYNCYINPLHTASSVNDDNIHIGSLLAGH